MAYRALYREWRSAKFSEVLGQDAVVKTLRRQIVTGRIAHAYLFCGSRGTGKTSLAKIMSRAINCLQPDEGEPCGVCDVCKAIVTESTLDVLELDAASNNSVDNVRDLLEQVRYPAQLGKYKVYIIDEVHMLSTAAFNALLKTLEEPPEHVVFIMATTEPQRIPATILSRVQRFDISRIPAELIQGRMQEALNKMQITAQEEALQMIARAAEGAMRDAWSILDMAVSAAVNNTITVEIVRDILGAADKDFLFGFADVLGKRDTNEVMVQIDQLIRSGYEAQVFMREMTRHLRALLIVKVVDQNAFSLLQCTQEDENRFRKQSSQFSQERLLRMMNTFMTADSEMRYASSPRIGLELAAMKACLDPTGEDSSALAERVAELEIQMKQMPKKITTQSVSKDMSDSSSSEILETITLDTTEINTAQFNESVEEPPKTSSMEDTAEENQPFLDNKKIWESGVKQLTSESPIYSFLRQEHFLGEFNNVFRVQISQRNKGFSYNKLRTQDAIDTISKILSNVAGRTVGFEAVLEGSAEHRGNVQDSIQVLTETIGRDLLQIDESEE